MAKQENLYFLLTGRNMPYILQLLIYVPLQLLLLPVCVFAYVHLLFQVLWYSKKHQVSLTATNPLSSRWAFHWFGVRNSEVCVKFVTMLPHISEISLWMLLGPAFIAYKICGYKPCIVCSSDAEHCSIVNFMAVRTLFFDRMIENHLCDIEQVVLLGSGFDLRSFEVFADLDIKVFDLDQIDMQCLKLDTLQKAGLKNNNTKYIQIDLNEESLLEKLQEAGFDQSKASFFLWEGVTPYLKRQTIVNTLKDISNLSATGSTVCFDFVSNQLVQNINKFGKWLLKITGECFCFGIDTESEEKVQLELQSLFEGTNFRLGELELLGKASEKKKPFAGLVEAVFEEDIQAK